MTQSLPQQLSDSGALANLRAQILAVVGDKGVIESADDMAPYLAEPRGRYQGAAPFIYTLF